MVAAIFAESAACQPIDAGALQRQTEQSMQRQVSPKVTIGKEAPPIAPAAPDETTVTVVQFQLVGNTLMTNDQLQVALHEYLNHPLSFAQLNQAAAAVAATYRNAGLVARAFLPQQEIDNRVVKIQIIESVFGQVRISDTSTQRIHHARLVRMIESAQTRGQPVDLNRIDRVLLLLDDMPGISVSGNLADGQAQGETDLVLDVHDQGWVSGSATVDNTGSRSTGQSRLSATLNVNSPLKVGDLLSTSLLKSEGSNYQRMAYTAPLGTNGWRTGGHASHLSYHLVGDFASLDGHGIATSSGVDLSYPLLRGQLSNINVSSSFDLKKFENYTNGSILVSNYKINVANIGLNANHVDAMGGGGYNTFSLGASAGKVNLEGSPNQTSDAATAHTAGAFTKLSLSISRLQTLTSDLSLYLSFASQTANKNLDSSERFYLGGSSGVRAYPTSEGGGSQGSLANIELRKQLSDTHTLTTFYDQGHITTFKENNFVFGQGLNSGVNPNQFSLQGYGFTLGWQEAGKFDVRATWARRIGANPIANLVNGLDGDGTKKINRVWLSGSLIF